MRSLRLSVASVALALLASTPPLRAQTPPAQDASPVDTASLLRELHRIRDQQTVQSKQTRQTALQHVTAAAGNAERAVALWEEAVRAVQFNGAPKENAGFREWKDKEGEALNGPLARNAARLFFVWLGLTIQRDGGMPLKELLPQVVAYSKELAADLQAEDVLEESIKHEKESANGNKRQAPQRKATDEQVRKMHDHILNRGLASSPVVQWLKLGDFVNPEKWEKQPGNLDGIFTQIILPELRVQHDPRALEYWDLKLRKEGEAAVRTKLAFDLEKFTTQRRPTLLWSRAEELLLIGQKNRAIGEMFGLIRGNPQHPESAAWIARLEALVAPAAPAAPAGSAAGEETPALPGSAPTPPAVAK